MLKEYTVRTTICDGCGKEKSESNAISGYTTGTWNRIYDKDFCYSCYFSVANKLISEFVSEEDFNEAMKTFFNKNAFGLTEYEIKELQKELNYIDLPTSGFKPLDCEALKPIYKNER